MRRKRNIMFICPKCKKNLCKEHYHNPVSCPFSTDKDEDEVKEKVPFNYQVKYCQFCKAEIKNIEPFECALCHGLFCSDHRLEYEHKCPNFHKEGTKSRYQQMKELAKKKREEAQKRLKK